VKDKGDGTYEVSYRGLPKYKGNAGNIVAYTLTEGDIAHYTTDSASIQGSGTTVEGIITNTYTPRPTTHDPAVEKKIEGPKPSSPDTFSFVLKRTDASFPMPAGSDGDRKTIMVEGAGSSEFGDIEFTLPGTYTYTITETKGAAACTYDGSSYALTYEVTDDGQGKLQAKRSMTKTVDGTTAVVDLGAQGDAVGAVFTNVYPEPADPEQPTNPTNPANPMEQAKPQKPSASSTPAGDSAATSRTSSASAAKALPRTGDGTLPYVLVILASLSAGAVLVGAEMKRRMA
ncbi:Spy0128 family protein, partial [Slackia exigua]|uniref:Spy0128 family protein n=1 Tax=Slackia exigua TaxID=84109 RepID=UPI003AB93BCA